MRILTTNHYCTCLTYVTGLLNILEGRYLLENRW